MLKYNWKFREILIFMENKSIFIFTKLHVTKGRFRTRKLHHGFIKFGILHRNWRNFQNVALRVASDIYDFLLHSSNSQSFAIEKVWEMIPLGLFFPSLTRSVPQEKATVCLFVWRNFSKREWKRVHLARLFASWRYLCHFLLACQGLQRIRDKICWYSSARTVLGLVIPPGCCYSNVPYYSQMLLCYWSIVLLCYCAIDLFYPAGRCMTCYQLYCLSESAITIRWRFSLIVSLDIRGFYTF